MSPNPLARVFPGAAQTPAHGVLRTLPTGPAPLFPARYRDFLPGSSSLARRMRICQGVGSVCFPDAAAGRAWTRGVVAEREPCPRL